MTLDHPSDDELARRLRDEVRAEAEEVERLAATAAARARSLADVVADLRGDTVHIAIGERAFTGTVVTSGRDYLTLTTAAGTVDVRLGGSSELHVVARGPAPAATPPVAPTFRARLLEHEVSGSEVDVGVVDRGDIRGRIVAVAVDHLVLRDADAVPRYVGLDGVINVVSRHVV